MSVERDECALLDDPGVRSGMSGALELKLLLDCGRISMPPATAEGAGRARSAPEAAALAEQLGETDSLVSDPALDTGGSTQSETSVVANGLTVCAAWNDAGEGFGVNGFSGFGFSSDGGVTFADGGPFPNGPSDTNRGDPSLVYSVRDGAYYYGALSSIGLSMWRSTNGCQSFQYVGPIHAGGGDDKELMAVDNTPTSPFYGRIHVGWTNFSLGTDRNQTAFSDDGGLTWSPAVTLAGSGVNGQGMYPAVAPNGDVYMALLNRAVATGGLQDQWIYKSVDGGVSWVKMTNLGTGQLRPENAANTAACGRQALVGDVRNLSSPQIVISSDAAASAGYVIHGVYPYDSDGAGPDQSNVFYRRSVDGGATWSAEVRLNDDTTDTDQFFPAIGANQNGVLVASWYDRRLDPTGNLNFDRYVSISSDGGLGWSANERVSDVSSPVAETNPNFDGLATCYHGDYDQVAVTDTAAHIVWSDDRRVTASGPNPDVYHDRVVIAPAVTVSPSVLEGGNSASGTVTLEAPAPVGGTSVTLSSNNPGVASVPASVVVPAAALSASFTVTTTPVTAQTAVTITATFPGGVTRTTVVTVLASPTVTSLSLSPTTVVGGQDSTGTVTLSGPAPAGGSNVALTSSHPSVATVPASLSIPAGDSSGTFTVTTVGTVASVSVTITAALNGTTRSAGLTVTEAPGNASFDPVLLAPRCNTVESFCDTGPTLVRGRDNMSGGAEPNAPNTILASCADGTSGSFHVDESLDRLRISTTDGTALQAGKTVRIDATVWVFSATSNWLDLFFAPDANGPVWAPIATLQASASGQQVISTTFTLPFGPLPAIRGNWRFSSTASPCTTGSFDDRDDLIFAIQSSGEDTTPPTATITAPSAGAVVRGTITVNATATDDVGVTLVELLVDGTVRGTDSSPPYSFALDTTLLGPGPHELLARASDAAENTGLSPTVSIVVDNVAPSVSITAPPANASVTGNVTISANAADTPSGVALVEFLADGAPIGSDSTAPYSVVWNTATVIPGAHTLSARASDLAGNQTLSANVPVTVVVNQAPVVSAGPDRTVTLPAAATLSGTASDDGLPAPPALTVAWSRTSGPGTVTFANPAAASTTATFSAAGVYVLRLTASDGAVTAFDEMQVTVNGGTATPCQGLCTNPTIFTINGSFQSGNLTTSARCFQTTSVIHGGNCGNFVSPRTLSVNGQQRPCNNQNWSSVPAPRNGGYCIQVTSGNHPWAYFTAW